MNFHLKKLILMLSLVAVAGCGKKSEQTTTVAPPASTAPAAAPAAATTVAANPVVVQNVNQSLADVDAALKARAYNKAVQTLLAVQQQQALSQQQAQQAANQMRALQSSLAAAVAAGDPDARAAADMLRHAHR